MAIERTLVLIKPHAVLERWTDLIYLRYLKAGLTIDNIQVLTLSEEEAAAFYGEHIGKEFFDGLISAMCQGPVVAMIWVGGNAIEQVRHLNGATNPDLALPGTIRYDFRGSGGPFNTVHGSDSPAAVAREALIIFGDCPI